MFFNHIVFDENRRIGDELNELYATGGDWIYSFESHHALSYYG
jgi:hypothetical protein